MSEYIDLRFVAENQPSLCIPRAFNNIDTTKVRNVIEDLKLGKISHIDIVQKQSDKGEPYKRIFIHFDKWFWNKDAKLTRQKLIAGKEIKIVYDEPWFWKVSASKCKPTPKPQPQPQPVHKVVVKEFNNAPIMHDTDEPAGEIFEPNYDTENVLKSLKKYKQSIGTLELEEGEIIE